MSDYQFDYDESDNLAACLAEIKIDLGLDNKPRRKPPNGYLCHLCFSSGHYIQDCPGVSSFFIF